MSFGLLILVNSQMRTTRALIRILRLLSLISEKIVYDIGITVINEYYFLKNLEELNIM